MTYDAVVVGSGPNGLSAAIRLAQEGRRVLVLEAADTPGGGVRSAELTLPGFIHDVCSAVHPLATTSPFFRSLPLDQHGLQWIHSPSALAHPLDDGTAVLLDQSVEATAGGLGEDEGAYLRLMRPLARQWEALMQEVMGPMVHLPRHPILLARFGLRALLPAHTLASRLFRGPRARALFAGIAAHGIVPLTWAGSSAVGLMLNIAAHARGWPIPRGGSQNIASALVSYLKSLGGEVRTGVRVERVEDLPAARTVFWDVTPRQLLKIAGTHLPPKYREQLRAFRYGPGIFKMDWALSGPIPWRAAECTRAATVHLGGTLDEITESELAAEQGRLSPRPFVLLAQSSLFDPTRAPAGQHTAWAYCHVPHAFTGDASHLIEDQIERFAPGFRSRILKRSQLTPAQLEQRNPNLIGGDIAGGSAQLRQLLARPTIFSPYSVPVRGWYLCSSSTPPGPGVHGMCGYRAAETVHS